MVKEFLIDKKLTIYSETKTLNVTSFKYTN